MSGSRAVPTGSRNRWSDRFPPVPPIHRGTGGSGTTAAADPALDRFPVEPLEPCPSCGAVRGGSGYHGHGMHCRRFYVEAVSG
jgi:hypothetical protein